MIRIDRSACDDAAIWGIQGGGSASQASLVLERSKGVLRLRVSGQPRHHPLKVDFLSPQSRYRCERGGGTGQAVARAAGLSRGRRPSVLDATAGLGGDAFVLAALGCHVRMFERNPVIAALLNDGLCRAGEDPRIGPWVRERMTLTHGDGLDRMGSVRPRPDVVYLDPMFEPKEKPALVKKEMRLLRLLTGGDPDGDRLLSVALGTAGNRVVVKRTARAPCLDNRPPHETLRMPKTRFDLYFVDRL